LTGSAGIPEEIECVVDVLAAIEWESA